MYIQPSGCSGTGWSDLTFSSPELTHNTPGDHPLASVGPVSPGHRALDHRQEIEQLRRQLETYQQREEQREQYRDQQYREQQREQYREQQRDQYREQYDWDRRQYREQARPVTSGSVREASLIVHERVVIVTPRVLITQGEAAETPQHQTPLPSHSEARDLVRLANCITPLDSQRALTPLDALGAVSPLDTKGALSPLDPHSAVPPLDPHSAVSPLDTQSAVSPLSSASLPASPAPLPQDTPLPSHQEARQLALQCGNIGHTFTIKLATRIVLNQPFIKFIILLLVLSVVRKTVCRDVAKV